MRHHRPRCRSLARPPRIEIKPVGARPAGSTAAHAPVQFHCQYGRRRPYSPSPHLYRSNSARSIGGRSSHIRSPRQRLTAPSSTPNPSQSVNPQIQTSIFVRPSRIFRAFPHDGSRSHLPRQEREAQRITQDRASTVADERRGIVPERRCCDDAEPHGAEYSVDLAVLRIEPLSRQGVLHRREKCAR